MNHREQRNIAEIFTIEVVLVNPIEKIISKLENKEFRDCDIKWIENKLSSLIQFAAKTLHLEEIIYEDAKYKPEFFNETTYNHYLKYFNTLLKYFKSFI